jgi:uncharacterized LabA/DUF88 family protein
LGNNLGDEQRLALFIDFENIAIGVRDAHYRKFDVNLVLERILDKGKLLVKRAYADWSRYSDYKRAFHEAAIELIEVPQKSVGGKNSADIRLVVDAMDMAFQKEHINCFVVASGDSDFSPLVSKLKENNKYVIGLGVKNSTSDLLIENCDEFIFYEDLVRGQQRPLPVIANVPEKQKECFELLVDSILALQRENKEILWGSMVKETMKRKKPSFNETYYGFRTFSHLLEDAQRRGIVVLRKDQRSGSYIVEDLGAASATTQAARSDGAPARLDARVESARGEAARAEAAPQRQPEAAPPAAAAAGDAGEAANGTRTRRRRGRGRRTRVAAAGAGAAAGQGGTDEAQEIDEPDEQELDEDDESPQAADEPRSPAAAGAGLPEERGGAAGSDERDQRPLADGQEVARPQPAEPGLAVQPADASAARPEPERTFSLFSWIRRDPPPTTPPLPDPKRERD